MGKQASFCRDTDPYRYLCWVIGSEDDFWCFDFVVSECKRYVKIHAVINCDTSGWIENAETPVIVPADEAPAVARRLWDAGINWCRENQVVIDANWHQISFPRALDEALGSLEPGAGDIHLHPADGRG